LWWVVAVEQEAVSFKPPLGAHSQHNFATQICSGPRAAVMVDLRQARPAGHLKYNHWLIIEAVLHATADNPRVKPHCIPMTLPQQFIRM
jgi:hypothetical protein